MAEVAVPTTWGTNHVPGHPEVTSLLLEAVRIKMRPFTELTPVEARKESHRFFDHFFTPGECKVTIKDKIVPSPLVRGESIHLCFAYSLYL